MFITLNLTKAVQFDNSSITRTTIRITTTTKPILRPLPQYLLAVKNSHGFRIVLSDKHICAVFEIFGKVFFGFELYKSGLQK